MNRMIVVAGLCSGLMLGWMFPSLAQEAPAPDEAVVEPEIHSDYQTLIAQVRPSIVTIAVSGRDGDQIGLGTGFVIDADGLIATNFHVIHEGRPFSVELASGRRLPVVSIHASDRDGDLALVRVDVGEQPLVPLPLSQEPAISQGTTVLAFGNPLGLRDSVVVGIVSAIREIEGRDMIQLAMPIEPGNSGGPIVDLQGMVRGIINMKSAIDDNLGFAIPISDLVQLRDDPNPVLIDRWVRLGRLDASQWTPLFGANWQQRGGVIHASGLGDGFGGRALCLSEALVPELPFEVAVSVRLDDESGAAGLALYSDGQDRHYGFYPSNGRLRLTCFKGPSVYSWEVLREIETPHYLPGTWNRLRVRLEADRMQCFVNDHLVIETQDKQLRGGKFGLVKFRDTHADFRGFEIGADLSPTAISDAADKLLEELSTRPQRIETLAAEDLSPLVPAAETVARQLQQQSVLLEQQAKRLRQLAGFVSILPTCDKLQALMEQPAAPDQLLQGALLIAQLDNPEIEVPRYVQRVAEMVEEIRGGLDPQAGAKDRREALDRYLFDENGFRGGRAEYYHPANSHLNRVIDDREGLPITLSILYMELGRQLGLTIEGVGLPGHFVVRHVDEGDGQLIDVFDRGALMTAEDAQRQVLASTGRPLVAEDLRAQNNGEILMRMLNNLVSIATSAQDLEAMQRYGEAMVRIDREDTAARMFRASVRGAMGQTALALEDVDWLTEQDADGLNYLQLEQLRGQLIQSQPAGE